MPYTVTLDDVDDVWNVACDGVLVGTVRSHYAVDEVLPIAETHAGHPMAWKLIPGGFESVAVLEG